jgi:hypothetical protein
MIGHHYTMHVETDPGSPSRFYDPEGRVVATATLDAAWNGVIQLGAIEFAFSISDGSSYVDGLLGRLANATSLNGFTLIDGPDSRSRRYELAGIGHNRFELYRNDKNVAVLKHAQMGNRVAIVGATSMPGFVGLLATLIVAFAPPAYARNFAA